eukprot:CAMPEP_0198152428 /NCGR_PEP_ID=MMETSP1443-20131203/59831_1 /TAXON_ID=186043 /ORGANISM="Entomoneis sp., Strain CCMP2396" /LENGTH=49 /DNA_ID= /DNA_START= /DNA_END= /DNA_ORIENTATION=
MQRKAVGEPLGMFPCHGEEGTQFFAGSKKNGIHIPSVGWEFCVDGGKGG